MIELQRENIAWLKEGFLWLAKQEYICEKTRKTHNSTWFFWWKLGSIYGHMELIQGNVPANEPGCNLKQTKNGVYPTTKQTTFWPAGSWDAELCYSRVIVMAHKAYHGQRSIDRTSTWWDWKRENQ